MEQAAVAQKRIVMARRLKKPDGEVDFVVMNQGCRGSRSAEAGFTRADANWYAHACQRRRLFSSSTHRYFAIHRSIES